MVTWRKKPPRSSVNLITKDKIAGIKSVLVNGKFFSPYSHIYWAHKATCSQTGDYPSCGKAKKKLEIHLLMQLDSSSVMFLESLGVSGLSTSYTLIQMTQPGLIRTKLVSRWCTSYHVSMDLLSWATAIFWPSLLFLRWLSSSAVSIYIYLYIQMWSMLKDDVALVSTDLAEVY